MIIDSEIKGDVLFLGYYDSEFDWTNETAKVMPKVNVLNFIYFYLFVACYSFLIVIENRANSIYSR